MDEKHKVVSWVRKHHLGVGRGHPAGERERERAREREGVTDSGTTSATTNTTPRRRRNENWDGEESLYNQNDPFVAFFSIFGSLVSDDILISRLLMSVRQVFGLSVAKCQKEPTTHTIHVLSFQSRVCVCVVSSSSIHHPCPLCTCSLCSIGASSSCSIQPPSPQSGGRGGQ